MYLPFVGLEVSALLLVLLGFAVGVLGGFFGLGGAFMVTPALNILGFPMSYAIGTDLSHVMGKSIVATSRHHRFGNVDVKLGVLMILGTMPGVELGKDTILHLERTSTVDVTVRLVYILLLGLTGSYMIYDYTRSHERRRARKELRGHLGTVLSRKICSIQVPPMVTLPASGIGAISIWAILLVALGSGFLAGFLGVGGGFVRVPALIYGFGVPTTVAIGTDLFEIVFSAGIGAFLYALEGKVEIVAAAIMLVGASFGAQLGTMATRHIDSMKIGLYFAATILSASVSVLLKQISYAYGIPELGYHAVYVILGASAVMSFIIVFGLLKNAMGSRIRWSREHYSS